MEIEEHDPLQHDTDTGFDPAPGVERSSTVLELPRAPTGNELKQKSMAYRVSDTSHRLDFEIWRCNQIS